MASDTATSQPSLKLTEGQNSQLETFVRICTERGYLQKPEGLGDEDTTDGFNDNATFLRYLQARSFNVNDAVKQFEEAMEIKSAINAPDLYENFDLKDFEHGQSLFPYWYGCRDHRGYPLCHLNLSDVDLEFIDKYTQDRSSLSVDENGLDEKLTSYCAKKAMVAHEYLTRFVLPLCSAMKDRPNPETPITGAVYLVNMETLNWKLSWRFKDYSADLSKMLAICYPEVIDRVYIFKAPYYVSTLWNIFQKFVDPGTAAKLRFIPTNNELPTLQSLMSVESIPMQYGGKFELKANEPPSVDAGLANALQWTSPHGGIPAGPLKWIDDSTGKRTIVAVGKVDGELRCDKVAIFSPVTGL